MDRLIVYPGAIPLDTDLLTTNRNVMAALHGLIAATLGTATAVDGLVVSATVPPSMNVIVGQGIVTAYGPMDATPYGSLPADTTDALVRMAVNLNPLNLTLTAPTVTGQSISYLIEAGFAETDTTPIVLPYYNAANPAMPYLGPGNNGGAQNTLRTQRVVVQLKAGAPALTGSQSLPPVDTGFVPIASIVVNGGATQINAADIVPAVTTRFTPWKLPDLRPGFATSQAFSSSGTFVVPSGVTRARVTVIGAGGAGGYHSTNPGGGGGSGGRGQQWITGLTPGSAIAVTVGASGVPSGSPGSGGAGGTSSFGSYVSATGGFGGGGGGGASIGGGPGYAAGAQVFFSGSYGGDAAVASGRGGDGGGPCAGKAGSGGAVGTNAPGFGGGGGGGGAAAAGGAGGGGLVIVEY